MRKLYCFFCLLLAIASSTNVLADEKGRLTRAQMDSVLSANSPEEGISQNGWRPKLTREIPDSLLPFGWQLPDSIFHLIQWTPKFSTEDLTIIFYRDDTTECTAYFKEKAGGGRWLEIKKYNLKNFLLAVRKDVFDTSRKCQITRDFPLNIDPSDWPAALPQPKESEEIWGDMYLHGDSAAFSTHPPTAKKYLDRETNFYIMLKNGEQNAIQRQYDELEYRDEPATNEERDIYTVDIHYLNMRYIPTGIVATNNKPKKQPL